MFADLDESIRRLLTEQGNLDSGEVDIAFDMPTREWAGRLTKPTVNLHLYDIRENTELRDASAWQVQRGPNNTAIKSRPVLRLDLTYSVTAFAKAVEDEHRLLSRLLLTFFQHPILPEEVLQGLVSGQEIRTTTGNPNGIFPSPADYWGALDNDLRPSIEYRLTLRMDLNQAIEVGLALTSRIRVGRVENGKATSPVEELPVQIGGRIHHRDDPSAGVPAAKVTLVERALDTTTDLEGRYTFSGVPAGKYTLAISAPGLDERREELEVPSEDYDVGI